MARVQIKVDVKINDAKLREIAKNSREIDQDIGNLASLHIEKEAKNRVPVLTGHLKSTITRISGDTSFASGVGGGVVDQAFRELTGAGQASPFGKLGRFRGAGGRFVSAAKARGMVGKWYEFAVAALAEYANYVEMGTTKMSAQPYLVPALESTPWNKIINFALRRAGLK